MRCVVWEGRRREEGERRGKGERGGRERGREGRVILRPITCFQKKCKPKFGPQTRFFLIVPCVWHLFRLRHDSHLSLISVCDHCAHHVGSLLPTCVLTFVAKESASFSVLHGRFTV